MVSTVYNIRRVGWIAHAFETESSPRDIWYRWDGKYVKLDGHYNVRIKVYNGSDVKNVFEALELSKSLDRHEAPWKIVCVQ